MEVRYVQPDPTAMLLEPDWGSDVSVRSDIFYVGRIYMT
jgi:hypothetical protein